MELGLALLDARERQQIVNHLDQAVDVFQRHAEPALLLRRERAEAPLQDHLSVPLDRHQGRVQLVRYVRQEVGLHLVEGAELCIELHELLVALRQLLLCRRQLPVGRLEIGLRPRQVLEALAQVALAVDAARDVTRRHDHPRPFGDCGRHRAGDQIDEDARIPDLDAVGARRASRRRLPEKRFERRGIHAAFFQPIHDLSVRASDQEIHRDPPQIAEGAVRDGRFQPPARLLQHQDAIAGRLERGHQPRLALGQGPLEPCVAAHIGHRAHQGGASLELGPGPGKPHLDGDRTVGGEQAADLARRLGPRAGAAQDLQDAK